MLAQILSFLFAAASCLSPAAVTSLNGGIGYLNHPPDHLSSKDCKGLRRTCLDRSTLLHCLPVSNRIVPGFTEACNYNTPVCVNDKCVNVATRNAPIEMDLSGVSCNGRPSVCLNCTTSVHCIQSGDKFFPVIPMSCPFHTPYCIDGKCGTKDPGRCKIQPPPKSNFMCAEGVEGYLPDPENCSVYHFCAQKTAYDYKCPLESLRYSHQKALCLDDQDSCFQLECTRPLEYVVYAPDPSVYALCRGSGPAGAILAKCPKNHTFDKSAESCRRTCLAVGRQSDPENINAYFECSQVNGTWLLSPGVCPAGAHFDVTSERCALD